jgi:hypothetical protein
MVNVFEQVLSEPKSKTKTAARVVALYIKAPLAVNAAGLQTPLLNDTNAVELLTVLVVVGTWDIVRTFPPDVYPVPTTSFKVVYVVV